MESKRLFSALIGCLLVLSVISFAGIQPVKAAFYPTICIPSNGGLASAISLSTSSTSVSVSLPEAGCGAGDLFIFSIYFPASGSTGSPFLTITGVTDNYSNSYVFEGVHGDMTACSAASASVCPGGDGYQILFEAYAATIVQTSNFMNVTIHYTGAAAYSGGTIHGILGAEFWNGLSTVSTESCSAIFGNAADGSLVYTSGLIFNGNGYNDSCGTEVATGDVAVEFGIGNFASGSTFAQVSNDTLVDGTFQPITTNTCPSDGAGIGNCLAYFSYYVQTGFTKPFYGSYYCASSCSGSHGNWIGQVTIVLASVANAVITTTTTVNTECGGSCIGASDNNGTGYYLTRNVLYYYAQLNAPSTGQIDNVTLKLAAVHMNVTKGYLYVGFYLDSSLPGVGNPWILSQTYQEPIINSSTGFIHINPQFDVPNGYYWAVGVMASPEGHSRGSGASLSGVSVYLTALNSSAQMYYAPPGIATAHAQTPPSTFFSPFSQTHALFIYIHETYTTATFTAYSTTTVGGTQTTYVTVDTTNVINQVNTASSTDWFLPLLFLLAPMALLIMVKKIATG